jgi:hypothetical protein
MEVVRMKEEKKHLEEEGIKVMIKDKSIEF